MPKRNIADSVSLRSSHCPGRKLAQLSSAMSMATPPPRPTCRAPAPRATPGSSAAARASRARARRPSCPAPHAARRRARPSARRRAPASPIARRAPPGWPGRARRPRWPAATPATPRARPAAASPAPAQSPAAAAPARDAPAAARGLAELHHQLHARRLAARQVGLEVRRDDQHRLAQPLALQLLLVVRRRRADAVGLPLAGNCAASAHVRCRRRRSRATRRALPCRPPAWTAAPAPTGPPPPS